MRQLEVIIAGTAGIIINASSRLLSAMARSIPSRSWTNASLSQLARTKRGVSRESEPVEVRDEDSDASRDPVQRRWVAENDASSNLAAVMEGGQMPFTECTPIEF